MKSVNKFFEKMWFEKCWCKKKSRVIIAAVVNIVVVLMNEIIRVKTPCAPPYTPPTLKDTRAHHAANKWIFQTNTLDSYKQKIM